MTDKMHGWQERVKAAEDRAQEESRQDGWRLGHHLMPPAGVIQARFWRRIRHGTDAASTPAALWRKTGSFISIIPET